MSSLLTDLSDRGLLDKMLVMLCGEFSRTPRMNDGGNGGPPLSMGTPGRDHWGNAMFCLIGGGGVKGGRIVGSTDRLGEFPRTARSRPATCTRRSTKSSASIRRRISSIAQGGRWRRSIRERRLRSCFNAIR